MAHEYDVIVVGAGSTGENVAERTVKGGLSAVVVEEDRVGGDCSYWACMPSKALLRPGEAFFQARHVAGAAQAVTGDLDTGAVLARRDDFTSHWHDDQQVEWLEGAGIDLVRGHGRLVGERRVEVEDGNGGRRQLVARRAVVLATGSRAALPEIPGLQEAAPWTSREATSAKSVPARLVVVGGGVVGCEMATAWSSLGSRVTLLARDDRLLPANEPFAGEAVAAALADDGATVRTGVTVSVVRRPEADGPVVVEEQGGERIEGDEVLMAVGRRPNTTDLGLETVGLRPGQWLEVDDTCLVRGVSGTWLYATGDLNHRALLTHMGKYQGRACGDAVVARSRGEEVGGQEWSRFTATADHAAVPQVIFTRPEVGAVGLTEEAARVAGRRVRVVEYDIGGVSGAAVFLDGYAGRAKLVVDEDHLTVAGATFVGAGVGELLHSATVAVVGQVPLDRLWHAVPSYPTISEVWLRLLEAYGL